MDIVSSVKSVVEIAINAYQRFKLFSVECNAYRGLLYAILDVLEDIEEQFANDSLRGQTSLSRPLNMIRESVNSGVEVLKLCSQKKKLRVLICSKEYMGRLAESKATIQQALALLPACGIVIQASMQSELNEATKSINNLNEVIGKCPHEVAKAVKEEFRVGRQDIVDRLFQMLERKGYVADLKDFKDQLSQLQNDKEEFAKAKAIYDKELIDCVCSLSLSQQHDTPATSAPSNDRYSEFDEEDIYLCHIMHTRMEDPVILVENELWYDRKHLCRWLLLNPNKDPYSAKEYDKPLTYINAIQIRKALMDVYGDGAYVKYDDSQFKIDYKKLWKMQFEKRNEAVNENIPGSYDGSGTPSNTEDSITTTSVQSELAAPDIALDAEGWNGPLVLPNEPSFTCSINGRNNYKLTDAYVIGVRDEDLLGEGVFGKIYRAKHKCGNNDFEGYNPSNEWMGYVAIKITKPTPLDTMGGRQIRSYDDVENYCAEIKILIRLRGENARSSRCLFMYEYFFTDRSELQIVTELLGKDLDKWRNDFVSFRESNARAAAKRILSCIEFIHSRKVVHRNLFVENILFPCDCHDPRSLKIVSFGFAKVLDENQTACDDIGSIGFVAPEIYQRKPYRFEVDMFSFGVLLFGLLSGQRPFPSNDNDVVRQQTIQCQYNMDGMNVSDRAKDLIGHLLINQKARWTATQCLQHEWFSNEDDLFRFRRGRSSTNYAK